MPGRTSLVSNPLRYDGSGISKTDTGIRHFYNHGKLCRSIIRSFPILPFVILFLTLESIIQQFDRVRPNSLLRRMKNNGNQLFVISDGRPDQTITCLLGVSRLDAVSSLKIPLIIALNQSVAITKSSGFP